jgi:hypothetical protein
MSDKECYTNDTGKCHNAYGDAALHSSQWSFSSLTWEKYHRQYEQKDNQLGSTRMILNARFHFIPCG